MGDNLGLEDIKQYIKTEDTRAREKRYFLARLLDEQCGRAHCIIAIKSRMGGVDSYIASVPLSWVAENVDYAGNLPLFEKDCDDGSKKIDANKGAVDFPRRGEPDWQRRRSMVSYLATREHPKFPPLLVVGYQSWTYDPSDDKWGMDRRAHENSVFLEALDSNAFLLNLHDRSASYYALDGQHRLMAIRGLRDLLENGELANPAADGEENQETLKMEDIIGEIRERRPNLNPADIKGMLRARLKTERIGIEIIPAAQQGETIEEAVRRLRQIFVDVN